MISLLAAACFFVGIHLFVSGTRLRDAIVARIGEGSYLALFATASAGGLAWLIVAYANAETASLWPHQAALRPVSLGLVFFAFLFVLVGLTTPSPTAVGGESQLSGESPARGILRITRHPFLWGVAIWAFAHLLVNEDGASLVLFAALLGLALAGPLSIDAKRKRRLGEAWDDFAAVTSNLPFVAIIAGRNSFVLAELGWWRLALGVAAYLLLLIFHARLFGVSPLPL